MEGTGCCVVDRDIGTRAGLKHIPEQQHLEVRAPGGQDDPVGMETVAVDDEHDVGVLCGLEEVEEVAGDVLKVLHISQGIKVDAYC